MEHSPNLPATDSARHSAAAALAADATRGSAIKLAAELGGRCASLFTTLLIARSLGVSAFGLFAAVSGIAAIVAQLADLGLQPLAPRVLVAGEVPLRVLLRAKLTLCAGVAALALALLPFGLLFTPLALFFTLAGLAEFTGVALRSRGHRGAEAALILLLRGSALVAVLTASRGGAGTRELAWALVMSALPAIALGGVLLGRLGGDAQGASVDPGTRTLLRTSFPLGLNGVLALGCVRLETLALGLARSAPEVGLYAAALRIVESCLLVPTAIGAGAMPASTREALAGGRGVRERTATTAALLAVPAAAGLVLLAPGLVGLLFGPAFAGAVPTLRLLALALVPAFMNALLLHGLIAAGRAAWLPRLTAIRLAAAAILAIALVPAAGASGAALGFLASELLLLALAARACANARFAFPIARPLAMGIAASIPMAVAVVLSSGGPLASVAEGGLIYAATLLVAWRFAPRLLPRRPDVRYS